MDEGPPPEPLLGLAPDPWEDTLIRGHVLLWGRHCHLHPLRNRGANGYRQPAGEHAWLCLELDLPSAHPFPSAAAFSHTTRCHRATAPQSEKLLLFLINKISAARISHYLFIPPPRLHLHYQCCDQNVEILQQQLISPSDF